MNGLEVLVPENGIVHALHKAVRADVGALEIVLLQDLPILRRASFDGDAAQFERGLYGVRDLPLRAAVEAPVHDALLDLAVLDQRLRGGGLGRKRGKTGACGEPAEGGAA